MEMRLLLSIKYLGIYCESMVKWTFHPKSRFGMVLFVLISTEKHPEGWFPFLSLRKDFFFPVKALLLFLFPWCFLLSIPCSCTMTCCKASVPGIPLPQGWIGVTSAAWLASVAVLHPMPSFPVMKNKAYSRGTVTHLLWGLQNLQEQSFFCTGESLAVLNHGTTERFRLAGQRENFPLLWEGADRLGRKPLLQSSTVLVNGACSCWAGRSSHFIYLPRWAKLMAAAQTALTQPRVTSDMSSPVLRTGLS